MKARFGDKVVIMGFPCNQFGMQEPGSNDTIKAWCTKRGFIPNVGIMFEKVKVNGYGSSPVFDFLKVRSNTGGVMWNFCKYVVAPDGVTVHKFGPEKDPTHLAPKIEELFAKFEAEE